MSYQFLDANSSVLTAQSSVISSVHYPVVMASIIGAVAVTGTIATTQSGAFSTSVVGTVSISSVVGAITHYAQPGSYVLGVSSVITGTTATSILSAPGAALRNYVTAIKVTNAAAVGVIVDIKDSGATLIDSGYAAASGGGWSSSFVVPLKQPTTNASIDIVPRAQASIIATVSGYVAP